MGHTGWEVDMREIKAVLTLLRTENGGRETAIANGHRPSFYIGDLQTMEPSNCLGRTNNSQVRR